VRRAPFLALVIGLGGARAQAAPPGSCVPVAGDVTVTEMARPPGLRVSAQEVQAVWTGAEVLVRAFGQSEPSYGRRFAAEPDGLFAYAPATNTWREVSSPKTAWPALRRPSFTWVAGRAVLWGGVRDSTIVNEGVVFDPAAGATRATSLRGAPARRQFHSAAAVAERLLVFGGGGAGAGPGAWSCDGGLYDPRRDAWSPLPAPPTELCPWIAGARVVAASPERAAVLFAEPAPQPRFRVAFFDVAKGAWTAGPIFAPGQRLGFDHAGAFGVDGALYLSSNGAFPAPAARVFRIDGAGRFEDFAATFEPGPVVRVGARLVVVGAGAVSELDLARRECRLPMRAVGVTHPNARQWLVATDDAVVTWGHGQGLLARWAPTPSATAPVDGNVRGGVVAATRGHCGGATPPPWDPRVGETRAPGLALLIRRGARNTEPKLAAEVRTDADGLFSAKLAPGPYCVVGEGQRAVKLKLPKGTDAAAAACLAEANAKCLATFEVPEMGTASVVVRVPNPCFGPCFRGPPPP
jgi:hypothetical protein